MSNQQIQIAKSFSKAAKSYEQAAVVQNKVGTVLLQLLSDITHRPRNILDIGCGTGKITHKLAIEYPQTQIYAIDIADGMLEYAAQHYNKSNIQWSYGNAENLSLKKNSIDIVFSNFTLQWCNFHQVMSSVANSLTDGGSMIFSSVVKPSLYQLQNAWKELDNQQHINNFSNSEDYQNIISNNNFFMVDYRIMHHVEYFDNIFNLLSSLNKIGSVAIGANKTSSLSKTLLKNLDYAYRSRYLKNNMLPLSYYVAIGHLIKV